MFGTIAGHVYCSEKTARETVQPQQYCTTLPIYTSKIFQWEHHFLYTLQKQWNIKTPLIHFGKPHTADLTTDPNPPKPNSVFVSRSLWSKPSVWLKPQLNDVTLKQKHVYGSKKLNNPERQNVLILSPHVTELIARSLAEVLLYLLFLYWASYQSLKCCLVLWVTVTMDPSNDDAGWKMVRPGYGKSCSHFFQIGMHVGFCIQFYSK